MVKADGRKIAEYGLARVAGGVPIWPQGIEPTLPLFTVVDGLCNELENVCPKPATPEQLSASPGEFVPTLKTILEMYDTIYLEDQAKGSSTQLPRLFSLCPLPSFRWRFITLNAELLASFFPSIQNPNCPAEYALTFYQLFNFEQFGFHRLVRIFNIRKF
jgi:hypothetical protein